MKIPIPARTALACLVATAWAAVSGLGCTGTFHGATGSTSFNDQREAVKPLFFLSIDAKGIKELPPLEPRSGS